MRPSFTAVAVFCVLVFAAPAAAQSDMPNELWSEYPLVQKVERVESSAIGPLLPPSDPDAAPVSDSTTRSAMWLALLALTAIALLFAAVAARPIAASGRRVIGGGARTLHGRVSRPTRLRKTKPMQLREHPLPPAPVGRRKAQQYAPLPAVAVAEPDIEREPRHYVARRSGLLRSRFVVVADEPGGKVTRVSRSRSFWRVGGTERREQAADNAWHELINDLRATGWEPYSTRRSDFYVLLRRIDSAPSSILPTIEAYTHASDTDAA